MSLAGSAPATVAADRVPSAKVTSIGLGVRDHVQRGEDRPVGVDDHAGAGGHAVAGPSRLAWMDTTEGSRVS